MKHQLYIGEMGGATVMSCDTLHLKNAVYPYDTITAENIERAIQKHTILADDSDEIQVHDTRNGLIATKPD